MCQYFDKRRGLANGIGTAAGTIGSFTLAPLVTYLLNQYGLRGTLLLTGGFSAHLLICGALLRPTEFYKPRWVPRKEDSKKGKNEGELEISSMKEIEATVDRGEGSTTAASDGRCCKVDGLSFLRQREFYTHVFVMALVYCGQLNLQIMLVPALAKQVGFTDYQGAYLLSIQAGMDGIGRIVFGWLLDHSYLPKPILFALVQVLTAVCTIIYPLSTQGGIYAAAGVMACIGFTMGIIHPGNFVLLVDKCGNEVIQRSLSALLLIVAVPCTFFTQISGKLLVCMIFC